MTECAKVWEADREASDIARLKKIMREVRRRQAIHNLSELEALLLFWIETGR